MTLGAFRIETLIASLGRPSGGSAWGTAILVLFLFLVVAVVATAMASPKDRTWLPMTIVVAYVVKLFGSTARYLVLEKIYKGSGDATGYHNAGLRLSETWRSFEVPTSVQRLGTDVVDAVTGVLYVPYQPSKLGGFFIFATLAFLGQLLFYAAFRQSFSDRHLKWYAALIFFWPTIVYWPSSIGKEALILPWIGLASYGVARLLSAYNPAWVGLIAVGLAGAATIRLHMSLLLAVGMFFALLLAKAPRVKAVQSRRLLLLGAAGLSLAAAFVWTLQSFGADLTSIVSVDTANDEVGAVLEGVEERTSTGGSAFSGEAATSILDVPDAVIRVLFRPLLYEADSALLLITSLEGTLLLIIIAVRLPWILRNLFRLRRYPYAAFAFIYSGGFILAFSSILNFGILARQRSQLLPLFFAFLVVMARKHVEDPAEQNSVPKQLQTHPRLELGSR